MNYSIIYYRSYENSKARKTLHWTNLSFITRVFISCVQVDIGPIFKISKKFLDGSSSLLGARLFEIEKCLKSKCQKQNTITGKNTEMHVDDMCQPVSKLHAQLLDLSAENAALDDALYFLDKAMYMGQMDCTTHLKSVRKLAKQQFRVRALLNKINQVLASNNTNKY